MSHYKFALEKYTGPKSRYICPNCGKKRFTKYIDTATGEYVGELVGRCDREIKCRYHFKPSQYLRGIGPTARKFVVGKSPSSPSSQKVYIPFEILKQSRGCFGTNTFVRHLLTLFGVQTVSRLIAEYHLGTSHGQWHGSCLFWFIDREGHIHGGQVKPFDDQGHTAKYIAPDGEQRKCTTWIHTILSRKLNPPPTWLRQYVHQEKKIECLFGEHLIESSTKPFAIVEAPATAIVASVYLPMFTWLACGSLSYLNSKKCEPLIGKKVVLFPDLGGYDKWKIIADNLRFDCSSLLEDNAPRTHKEFGYDLRDYLEKFDISQFIAPNTDNRSKRFISSRRR